MALSSTTGNTDDITAILEHFVGERGQVLETILDRSTPVTVEELASQVSELGGPDVARADLVHTHLPALTEAGLLSWDRDRGTVTTTDHPALDDSRLGRVLSADDDILECLADERRRTALATLHDYGGRTFRWTLARDVAAQGADRDDVETVLVALHHVHLPKLADAGLVEYDQEAGTVASCGQRTLESIVEFYNDDYPR